MEPLLNDINAFIQEHSISERSFGEMALNDTKFVADVRAGRSPSLRTVEKLRRFMSAYPNRDRAAA